MSKSRSLKSASKQDPKSGPGSKLIHLGRGQIAVSNDTSRGKKSKKQRRQARRVAAGGAKNLMAGYEQKTKAKKK